MEVGDLVRHFLSGRGHRLVGTRVGLVVDVIQKKCWRTQELGPKVNWDLVKPETHAVVLYPHNCGAISIPIVDLEVINGKDESR